MFAGEIPARNHERGTMSILRLCDQECATVNPKATALEAIRLMLERGIGSVVVVDGSQVAGIFTERDVLKKLALSGRDPASVLVSELMTAPVVTVSPQTTPPEALTIMLAHHFRHLPVVDASGRLRGVLSIRNLLHGRVEQLRQQLHSLENYVVSEEPGATKARG